MKRLLTGDRPTGSLHLGHYVGSLQNRLLLQQRYECYFLIADLHTLTTRPTKSDIDAIGGHAHEMVLDYLACGIDPAHSTIYLQSAVPEIYELNLIFEMLVTVPRLQRLPSLKEMREAAGLREMSLGLLGYPVLQSADILLPLASVVPVGKDNEAHIELAREIARRFNSLYGDVFPIPEAIIGEVATLVGTDGANKMSKSLKNAIMLSDESATVEKRVMSMYTDPNRIRADVPGRVEGNPVFIYHRAFNSNSAEVEELEQRYRSGTVGDVEVKKKLARAINAFLAPLQERRHYFASQKGYVEEVVYRGTGAMRSLAQRTMRQVRDAMGLTSYWKAISGGA